MPKSPSQRVFALWCFIAIQIIRSKTIITILAKIFEFISNEFEIVHVLVSLKHGLPLHAHGFILEHFEPSVVHLIT